MKTNQPEKVLRVGVIHNGRILEERLILKRADVTVGRGRDATISLPLDELPVRAPLFVVKRGRYHLAAGNGVRAQLRSGGASIETGPGGGGAPSRKTLWGIGGGGEARLHPLDDDAQGRAEIGGVTILFQFVHPPPPMPAVKLPELARIRWSGRIDRPFATVLGFIVLAHIGVVMAVQSAPLPIIPDGVLVQDSGGRIIEVPFVPPKEEPKENAGDGKESPPEEEKPVQKRHAQEAKPNTSKGIAQTRTAEETRSFVATQGVLGVLRAKGSSGTFQQLFDDGPRLAGLDELIESNRIASRDGDVSTRRWEESPRGHKGDPIGVDLGGNGPKSGPSPVAGIKKGDVAKLDGRIDSIELPQVEGCLEAAKIAAIVKMKLRGLQDCYERELKKSPSLSGRLAIAFTLDGEGAVTEARVESNEMGNTAVGDCLVTRLKRFKFPKSDCASVTVSYPFIFVKTN